MFGFSPEFVFGLTPECCSESARNAVRLHPGMLFGLPRNTQEEILAEGPIRYGGVQVAIRGSDNANVDSDRLPSPHSIEFPFL